MTTRAIRFNDWKDVGAECKGCIARCRLNYFWVVLASQQ
jgi:hypothetical protein